MGKSDWGRNVCLPERVAEKFYEMHIEKDENKNFFDNCKSYNNVIVCGPNGAGKSSVINSIFGRKLTPVPQGFGDLFNVDTLNPVTKIEHDYCDNRTQLNFTEKEKSLIWENTALANSVVIDQSQQIDELPKAMHLLRTVDSAKFVFVAPYSYIDQGSRGQDFSKALQVFVSTFKDIDTIKDSILLVVSRVPAGVEAHNIINELNEIADIHQVSDNTKKMIRHLTNSMYVFHSPTKEGEVVKGPGWELIEKLEPCDVRGLVQLSHIPNQHYQKAIVEIVKEADQEVADRKKFEDAGINMDNIPNASFFKKVINFLHDGFSNLTILAKLGEYIGGIFTSLASLAGGNNFKNPTFTDEMETQLTPKKIQLAKCIVKVLSCDDGNLNEEIDKKFTECVKKYANSNDDEFKQNTVKEFADFLKSKIDLRKELANFADKSQSDDELYLEDSSDDESFNKETKKVANVQSFQSDQEESDNLSNDKTTNSTVTKLSQEKSKALTNKTEEEDKTILPVSNVSSSHSDKNENNNLSNDKTTNSTVAKLSQEKNEVLSNESEEEDKITPVSTPSSHSDQESSNTSNDETISYRSAMEDMEKCLPEPKSKPQTFLKHFLVLLAGDEGGEDVYSASYDESASNDEGI